MTANLVLYGYWRSTAAYRVRIALNLKGLVYENRPVHLVREGGEQHASAYASLNPQQLVPTLQHGERILTQSMAILEYVDESWADPPLLPREPRDRARVRSLAQTVVADIHPLGNLRALQYLQSPLGVDEEQRAIWSRHWQALGLAAIEASLAGHAATGSFCHGDSPTLADICLIPQLYNAARWKLPLEPYPTINRIAATCAELEAFQRAEPEMQPDAAG